MHGMEMYAFILGRKFLLSIAELCHVIGSEGKILDINHEAMLVTFDEPLKDPQECLSRLGGVVKIVRIFNEDIKDTSELSTNISARMISLFGDRDDKLIYGVSTYNFAQKREIILRKTLIQIKKQLTAAGLKSRFINKNFQNLESAAIKGEKILQKGAEIVIIQAASLNKIVLGETVALQDFEGYSHRDFDRPARDARLGMLPPKLAQIMINLAGKTQLEGNKQPTTVVYDPFVGIGTVPMEALLLGYSVLGSDISPEVIDKAQKNTDWLLKDHSDPTQKIRFFTKDATTLTKKDVPENIGMVVTETFLGPPVSQFPPSENMKRTFSHIRELLTQTFRTLGTILKPGTPVVLSTLFYRRKDNFFFIEKISEDLEKFGFSVEPLISKDLINKFQLRLPDKESLIYDRPDQIVGREIWKFVKK